ncbi:MAG: UDP-N-acetylmuramoyl-tripeptide--D-alanyl-D-alanine ligase [Planctomycetota bacterium]|nr:UDP-N-acetylmuramoyl-tripeptide--D-alanyl-D-alanine ligase [Planctomycetota bacterium]
MEQISIRKVAAWTGGRYEGPDLPVAGVTVDSRRVEPQNLYVPLRGPNFDGHSFLGEAFVSGAAAALADDPEAARLHRSLHHPVVLVRDTRRALGDLAAAYRKQLGYTVVAVTGSNGKTTTKEMILRVLGRSAVGSPNSYNNDVGVPLTLLSVRRHHSVCVVEVGTSAPGQVAALAALARPDVSVVLNVGESHLERLGDLDGVAREKFALVEALSEEGCAILNYDDDHTRAMIEHAPGYVLSFGTWPAADVYAGDVKASFRKLSFRLYNRMLVRMSAFGIFNVHNALAATAVGLWLKREPEEIRRALEGFVPLPMRMTVEHVSGVRLIHDAYNANPRSTVAALHEIRFRGGSGRRIAVLGDMLELGTQADELHRRVGRAAAEARIDVLWAIGPLSQATSAAARNAGLRNVFWSPTVKEALQDPPFQVRRGDVVLFKASRLLRLERLHEAVRTDLSRREARRKKNAPRGARKSRRSSVRT